MKSLKVICFVFSLLIAITLVAKSEAYDITPLVSGNLIFLAPDSKTYLTKSLNDVFPKDFDLTAIACLGSGRLDIELVLVEDEVRGEVLENSMFFVVLLGLSDPPFAYTFCSTPGAIATSTDITDYGIVIAISSFITLEHPPYEYEISLSLTAAEEE
jgi:hypothetical protein